jgi:two-component system sensor histidine kinase TctE
LKPSIRSNLLKWLILPLMGINLIGAALAYWLAWVPAETAFDQSLADSAWALIPRLKIVNDRLWIDLPQPAEQILRVDHFDAIYFVVRSPQERIIAGDSDFPVLTKPDQLDEPIAYDGAMRGEPIRIISLRTRIVDRDVLIGVAETLHKRHRSRLEILAALVVMEIIVTALLTATVWLGIGKGLLPLRRIQDELNVRRRDDLQPLPDAGLALELAPVVEAMNGLLQRVRDGSEAKQKFLADVAHQLRTPLAGVMAQLEWLRKRIGGDVEAAQSADLMMSAVERMTRQTNQLLSLAHADPSQFEKKQLAEIRLDKLIEESIQQFVRQADTKSIDLGFQLEPTTIVGDRFLLRDLIDNLIDNALRYSPANSTVTVTCLQDAHWGTILVEDDGPGIPASARELLFDRFYRLDDKSPGSGLGLAIVRDIAEDHNAVVDVRAGKRGVGTVFSVCFPRKLAADSATARPEKTAAHGG